MLVSFGSKLQPPFPCCRPCGLPLNPWLQRTPFSKSWHACWEFWLCCLWATPTSKVSVVVPEPAPPASSVPGSPPCYKRIISHQVLLTSPGVAGRTEGSTGRECGAHSGPSHTIRCPPPAGETWRWKRDQAPLLSTLCHQPRRETWEIPLGLSELSFLACTTGLRTVPLGGGKDQGGYMQSLTLLASTSLRLSPRALVRHFTAFEAWTHHYHCLRL